MKNETVIIKELVRNQELTITLTYNAPSNKNLKD